MPDQTFHRSPTILSARVGQILILLDSATGENFELNAVAASLWRHLDEPRDIDALAALIHAEFDVAPGECARALRETIGQFEASGLAQRRSASDPAAADVETEKKPEARVGATIMPRVPLSPELAMCVRCCRDSFDPDDIEQLDWPRLLRIARFHRVQALVWDGLSEVNDAVPGVIADQFVADANQVVLDNLHAAVASKALLGAFSTAGTDLLFVKGLTLGALAYRNPALKSSIDIDLLVDPADLGASARILRDAGFVLTAPSESPGDEILHAWHRGWKESVWASSSPPLQIDLHTRTADHPRLIPSIDVHSPRQLVDIGNGIALPTLARDELFAYLAVHGASSAWFRLKWIADFAAFLGDSDEVELDRLYRRSQTLGAGRAAGQALLLADDLFASLRSSPDLRAELRADRAIVALERAALRLLTGAPIEPTERRFGTLTIHRTQLSLLPGIGFTLSEMTRQLRQKLARPR